MTSFMKQGFGSLTPPIQSFPPLSGEHVVSESLQDAADGVRLAGAGLPVGEDGAHAAPEQGRDPQKFDPRSWSLRDNPHPSEGY